jgi:hypothetical protein
MAQYYDYKTPIVALDGTVELGSAEVPQLNAAAYHQISFAGGAATAGTLTASVKWRGSPTYVALATTIDISAPSVIKIVGYIDDIKIVASGSNGFFMAQVVGGSMDEAIIDENSASIAVLETSVGVIELNLRGTAVVDMGNVDYTMTDAEAQSIRRVMANVGTGKTVTVPTTADSTVPELSIIDMRLAGANVDIVLESGGSPLTIYSGRITVIAINTTLGEIQDMCAICAEVSNSITNGVTITDTVNNIFTAADAGKQMVFNAVGAQAWTIDTVANSGWRDNSILYLFAEAGSGGITVTGEAGVTLSPASIVFAAGTGGAIAMSSTNTWNRVA